MDDCDARACDSAESFFREPERAPMRRASAAEAADIYLFTG
jgi:hypothetical protein